MGYTYEQLKAMGATSGPATTGASSPKKKYTYDELLKAGASPVATPAPEKKTVGGFLSNVPGSAGNLIGGVANMFLHPVDTVKAVGELGAGAVEKLIPGRQASEDKFDAVTNFYKERYKNLDAIGNTLYEDPVGFAADAATLFSGGGAAVTKVGKVSQISKLAKAGNVISKVGDAVNPITQATKLVGKGAEALTAGRKIGGKKYTTENLAATDNLGIDRNELPIFASTKSPISTTAEAVASKGLGGSQIWKRIDNIYTKMNDTVDSLVKGKLDVAVVGKNISNAVDDFKNSFFEEKNKLYKEAVIPKPKVTQEIPGYENVKKVVLGAEDPLFSSWKKEILPDGRVRYTKPTEPLFSGNQTSMPASTVATQKIIKTLVDNEKQALKGYGAKSSPELKTYEGLLKGLSDKNMTTSDVYRTLQKLEGDIKFGTTLKTGNNAKLSLIRESLDAEFLATLKQQRPDLAKSLEAADNFYRQGVKKINSGIIQTIVKNADRPDLIVKNLLPKLDSLEDVKLLVEVVGQKNMVEIRKSILSDIFTEAKGVAGENLQPLGISRQIKKYGKDKLEVLLSPDQIKAVEDLEQISKMMGKSSRITSGSQTSFNLLSTVGGGSVMTAMTLLFMGNVQGAILSLSPLLGTLAASKVINSSLGRKILTEGVELSGKTGRKIQSVAPQVGKAGLMGNQLNNIYKSQEAFR